MFATIRFTTANGRYAEKEVHFPVTDYVELAIAASALCNGYLIGSGTDATIMKLEAFPHRPDPLKTDHDFAGFSLYLASKRETE